MTPKEKAKEIYSKFWKSTPQPYRIEEITEEEFKGLKFQEWDKNWTTSMAKAHSILCIEEIIADYRGYRVKHHLTLNSAIELAKFWEEVKEEIEKI